MKQKILKKISLLVFAFLMIDGVMAQDAVVNIPAGYHGYLEQSQLFRLADGGKAMTGISTTHGVFIDSKTFVGIGFGIEGGNRFFAVPIFTAVRYNFSYKRPMTPTVQLRMGSYISGDLGIYTDLAVGLRRCSISGFGINVMLTGTYYSGEYYLINRNVKYNPSSIGIRVGFEW